MNKCVPLLKCPCKRSGFYVKLYYYIESNYHFSPFSLSQANERTNTPLLRTKSATVPREPIPKPYSLHHWIRQICRWNAFTASVRSANTEGTTKNYRVSAAKVWVYHKNPYQMNNLTKNWFFFKDSAGHKKTLLVRLRIHIRSNALCTARDCYPKPQHVTHHWFVGADSHVFGLQQLQVCILLNLSLVCLLYQRTFTGEQTVRNAHRPLRSVRMQPTSAGMCKKVAVLLRCGAARQSMATSRACKSKHAGSSLRNAQPRQHWGNRQKYCAIKCHQSRARWSAAEIHWIVAALPCWTFLSCAASDASVATDNCRSGCIEGANNAKVKLYDFCVNSQLNYNATLYIDNFWSASPRLITAKPWMCRSTG